VCSAASAGRARTARADSSLYTCTFQLVYVCVGTICEVSVCINRLCRVIYNPYLSCLWVCSAVSAGNARTARVDVSLYMYLYMHLYMYVCVGVCVSVCVESFTTPTPLFLGVLCRFRREGANRSSRLISRAPELGFLVFDRGGKPVA